MSVIESRHAQSMPLSSDDAWRRLRDYVVNQILEHHGDFVRDPLKESGIFKSFVARWGEQSFEIARVAFEVHGGIWHSAPIRVSRFCKNCDPFFASVIASNL
jgi:hypothetical protein